jgi:hypothetical protein
MVQENWLKVALTAMALGGGLYVNPLAMIAHQTLIQLSSDPGVALLAFGLVGLGLPGISRGLVGKAPLLRRAGFFAADGNLCLFWLLL